MKTLLQIKYAVWLNGLRSTNTQKFWKKNANNPASVWKLFKEIGASKRKGSADIFSLKTSDNVTENPKDIANEFNKFFCDSSIKNQGPYWDFQFW